MLLNRLILPIFVLAGTSFGQGYGSIEGTVTGENGMTISDATVYAFSIGGPTAKDIPTAETNAAGHYIFKRLDYGSYAVAPAKPADGIRHHGMSLTACISSTRKSNSLMKIKVRSSI